MPKVSIVVPSYNSAEFIAATIESIEAQTFSDYEIIVSDHSSTDGTAEILQRYADEGRIKLTTLASGGGAPANWRAVTELATGQYLKLVCGDDLLAPTILAEQVAALDSNPRAVMAASKRDLVDAQGKRIIPPRGLGGLNGVMPGHVAVRRSVLRGTNIFGEPGCVLLRHESFREAGGWTDAQPYVIDQFSYCQVLMLGDFVTVPGSLASFRISDGQWSVELTHRQAAQVIGMHHDLADRYPGLLSRRDLLIGDSRARLMASARRLTYLWLGRRMRAGNR
ncbi:glycosyltransferase family 2 protein [Tessaracoccus oleiagri]|uniref:Glycosyl transferase family 2 n=1 Tax=Tessaracoccus oleiagri TaxID=686624 RepID=A0A1G9HFT7_9ACTN|nr:glycosyltransferase family 2 protein [Tessaracoccus oleiagri]SDL11762.1 Glycosyl transferase family 2 [Tessaracoccus oleiagri]